MTTIALAQVGINGFGTASVILSIFRMILRSLIVSMFIELMTMIRLITMPIWAMKAIMGLTAIWIPHWSVDGGHLTAVHSNLTIMG